MNEIFQFIIKAGNREGLVPVKIQVKGKNGTFPRTYWVRPEVATAINEGKISLPSEYPAYIKKQQKAKVENNSQKEQQETTKPKQEQDAKKPSELLSNKVTNLFSKGCTYDEIFSSLNNLSDDEHARLVAFCAKYSKGMEYTDDKDTVNRRIINRIRLLRTTKDKNPFTEMDSIKPLKEVTKIKITPELKKLAKKIEKELISIDNEATKIGSVEDYIVRQNTDYYHDTTDNQIAQAFVTLETGKFINSFNNSKERIADAFTGNFARYRAYFGKDKKALKESINTLSLQLANEIMKQNEIKEKVLEKFNDPDYEWDTNKLSEEEQNILKIIEADSLYYHNEGFSNGKPYDIAKQISDNLIKLREPILDKQIEKMADSDKIKAMKSVAECKNFTEYAAYMKGKYGIKIHSTMQNEIDLDTVIKGSRAFDTVFKEFPGLKGYIPSLGLTHSQGTGASVTLETGDMDLGFPFQVEGQEHYNELMSKGEVKKIHPNDCWTYEGMIFHELGHVMERALTIAELDRTNSPATIVEVMGMKKSVSSRIANQALENIGYDYRVMSDDAKQRQLQRVSLYGATSYIELLAEAIADTYMNGEDANELSIEITKIVKKGLNDLFKGEK